MDKAQILKKIQLLTNANNGKAPGSATFESKTGIKKSDWYPHFWLRWGDALIEAGYVPNKLQTAIPDESLIHSYIDLVRELGHVPVGGEIRRKAQKDRSFPSHNTFNKFGGKSKLIDATINYCNNQSGYEDVVELLNEWLSTSGRITEVASQREAKPLTGFVYLMKSGRHYKIGRTVSVGSRERQLAIKIPVPPKTIHSIETDDPVGVESYWHRRFAEKRGEGEWFDLSFDDIKAFKRWKKVV